MAVSMTFFIRTLVLISLLAVLLPTMTNAAPANHKRHNHEPWHNTCNLNGAPDKKVKITPASKRFTYVKTYKEFAKINFELNSMTKAISTKNVSTWLWAQKKSFTDLAQIGKMKNINNPYNSLHTHLQIYIGYFQYLHKKQHQADNLSNEGSGKTTQLEDTMNYAKALLCDIETALNLTTNNSVKYLTTAEMHKIIVKTSSHALHTKEEIATSRFSDFVRDVVHSMKPRAEKFELMAASGEKKNAVRRRKSPLKPNQKKVVGNKKNLRKGMVKKVARG